MLSLLKKTTVWTVAAIAVLPLAQAATHTAQNDPGTPTVVLVHGYWADGSCWAKVIRMLQAKGIHVVSVQNPLRSLKDDVATTRRLIDMQKGPVVLVGHSWGGMVITQAGNDRKVKSLVYVAAFAPSEGESVNSLGGKKKPAWLPTIKRDSGGFLYLSEPGVRKYFAPDLPAAEAKVVAATQIPPQAKALDDKVTSAAWKHKPSWYIVAKNDRMIPPGAERMMAKRIRATTTIVNSSHVVMLSKPKEVTAVILAAFKSTQKQNRRE